MDGSHFHTVITIEHCDVAVYADGARIAAFCFAWPLVLYQCRADVALGCRRFTALCVDKVLRFASRSECRTLAVGRAEQQRTHGGEDGTDGVGKSVCVGGGTVG